MLEIIEDLAFKVEASLGKHEIKGRTITLKIKFYDFKSITRSVTEQTPVDSASDIMRLVKPLLLKTEAGAKKVRLLGVSVSNFGGEDVEVDGHGQLLLPLKFRWSEPRTHPYL